MSGFTLLYWIRRRLLRSISRIGRSSFKRALINLLRFNLPLSQGQPAFEKSEASADGQPVMWPIGNQKLGGCCLISASIGGSFGLDDQAPGITCPIIPLVVKT